MNPEIKQKWLDALRSGEYEQTSGALKKVDDEGNYSYCCLGVLCDLVAPDKWVSRENNDETIEFGFTFDSEYFEYGVLPRFIYEEVGLSNNNPVIQDAKFVRKNIATLNDAGLTFTELADLIEKEL